MLSDCLIGFLSLRELSFALSSCFEQFGSFTCRLKVSRQLSIVFRCLMKQQCVYRFKFQRDCLIELLCSCVVSRFVGEGFHFG
ncbi:MULTISPECIES: DUF3709 domain-containing protein [Vibrio]|uniref:DUF3709 domain-containing protein n=1 Tax=Vibrio TaxID=662 RepID=UPI0001D5A9E7|nr:MULTISPECIES: DUF3709 domain-containing protein [Vibrio]EFH72403.1 conserved hypothetical protein [Vibrio cholerae RC385]EJL6329452.1 DUF3709 domain-containing protein [Vibrio cholerae]EJL6773864.1 DUF3709 domain-containing protein [Vibrio cholerae]EJL6953727.1 DUF3709 domain-containing protein [Vibrio cholerae]EJL6980244.1 DUF3709 domain-containing protein [Vibrio cholerae]